MQGDRLCALSVDLDEIHHYYAIHAEKPEGHSQTPGEEFEWSDAVNRHAVYDCALERLEDFAKCENLPLTLFGVGADLARDKNADALRRMVRLGHELGNHTLDHCYDLTRKSEDDVFRQIDEANRRFEAQVGVRPTGFRAPGYCVNQTVYRSLKRAGMKYSSSVFPCPYYYGAKAVALALIALRGGNSSSIVDDPRVLLSPSEPYRVGERYWRRGAGMMELPIQVTRRLRLPFFGTVLSLGGVSLARRMARSLVGERLVNLELHGIDFLDASDGLRDLSNRQRDLRVTVERKMKALGAVVAVFRDAGYQFVRLDEAANRFE